MNLDDLEMFRRIDADNMIGHIHALPDQLRDAWAHGAGQPLPDDMGTVARVALCGMGGSAIGGEMLAALVEDTCPVPIRVNRSYELPAWADGPSTLVVTLSHSGGTEETLSCAQQAITRKTKLLAITTGGELAVRVEAAGGTVWRYGYESQPRAAIGWLYGLLLAAFSRMGLAPDLNADVAEAAERMERSRASFVPETLAARNPPKRYAGQLVDCIPVIWGAGLLAPVARRWKTQINENAKSSAFFELLPELDHNAVVGIATPAEILRKHQFQVIQLLSARYDHPRVALRHQMTLELFREQGIITDTVKARGESRLAQQMSLVQFGDYVSYYLAMAYEIDPTPIGPIVALKAKMAAAG
jgi:glucose/mannose-6-phosphate isomerase